MLDEFIESLVSTFYPLSLGPVIRLDDSGERELTVMEWGLLPAWWKPSPKMKSRKSFQRKCFNARCETAYEKPTFRAAYRYRHCLVPVSRFDEKEAWFGFRELPLFAFAGLWEHWEREGEVVESYTFLTTEPHPAVKAVGHPRMPVVLTSPEEQQRWLSPDFVDPGDLFLPLRPETAELCRLDESQISA